MPTRHLRAIYRWARVLLLISVAAGCGHKPIPDLPEVVALYSRNDDPIAEHMAETLEHYLKQMGINDIVVEGVGGELTELELSTYFNKAAFLINPQDFFPEALDRNEATSIPEEGFLLRSVKVFEKPAFVIAAHDKLGLQYGIYELLYLHGVRFFHPEQEWIPASFRPRGDINTIEGPAFKYRGYSLHTTHPVELIDPLSDSEAPWSYAKNWMDWLVKMHSNKGQGSPRGVASEDSFQKRAERVRGYNELLGFRKGTGFSLHGIQQGGRPGIDWSSSVPIEQQIRDLVDSRLGSSDDIDWFGIHFGPTEYTTTPCDETLYYLDYTGRYVVEQYPGVLPVINSHITGDQSCGPDFEDLDYYDLGVLTDPRIAIQFHTVMFYDLIGPAPCYNREDFTKKLELMRREAPNRTIWYYPEGAWWLGFDNDAPLFLPIYIYTRWNDIQTIKPLLKQGLNGHKMFTTGQEWGYWMQDYLVGRLQWNPDLDWTEVLRDLTDIMGDAGDVVQEVLVDMALYQDETLINQGLMRYMAGENKLDELGVLVGFQSHELKLPFHELMGMTGEELDQFAQADMTGILDMAEQYDDYLVRMAAVEDKVPPRAMPWFREIYDGVEIDGLRARHIYNLYEAVSSYRRRDLTGDEEFRDTAWEAMGVAEALTEQAKEVIARRELDYRYPLEWSTDGGLTPETEKDNGTVYPFRVFTKAHLAHFWTRRNIQARSILEDSADPFTRGFYVEPAIAAAGTPLEINYPGVAGVTATIDYGDGTPGDHNDTSHNYSGIGCWEFIADVHTPGYPDEHYTAMIGRVEDQYYSDGSFNLMDPDNPTIEGILGPLMPKLHLGINPPGPATCVVVAQDLNNKFVEEKFVGEAVTSVGLPLIVWSTTRMETGKVDMSLYITFEAGEIYVFEIPGKNCSFSAGLAGGAISGPITMTGELNLETIIDIMVALVGFDEWGARTYVAELLGYTVETMPEYLAFIAELGVDPI